MEAECEAVVADTGAGTGADTPVDVAVGFGGGGMEPLGGPYCMMGRNVELLAGAGFGSFTAYMVTSS